MKVITRVTVSGFDHSRNQRIYPCQQAKTGWLCGKCGIGMLGRTPAPGASCPECGAVVEEAL
jgi:rubrerythrin